MRKTNQQPSGPGSQSAVNSISKPRSGIGRGIGGGSQQTGIGGGSKAMIQQPTNSFGGPAIQTSSSNLHSAQYNNQKNETDQMGQTGQTFAEMNKCK